MAKLRFLVNGRSLGEYKLNKERLTIGRLRTCDIYIDNLTVSGEHAAVITIGTSSYVEDLNSTNGTIVNNQSIQKHVLQDKDIIEFGSYQIHYCEELENNLHNNNSFEKTVMIKSFQNKPQELPIQKPEINIHQPSFIQADSNHAIENTADLPVKLNLLARLKVLNGNSAGRELKLDKAIVRFGKIGVQVAVIIKRPNGYFISHIEGAHSPTVNGLAIGLQAHSLQHLDVVELAGTKMEFNLV